MISKFMTSQDLAEFLKIEPRTIRGWVLTVAEKNSVIKEKISVSSSRYPAQWTMDECLQIVRIGRKDETLAQLLENSAKASEIVANAKPDTAASKKLPSGAQMNAMAKIYGNVEAGRIIKVILGIGDAPDRIKAHELPAPIVVRRGFSDNPKANRQGFAVARDAERREQEKAERDQKQVKLFGAMV